MKFASALLCGLAASVKINGDDNGFFLPTQSGQLGAGGYNRDVPARFSADSDDIFMRSMYNNYAIEAKDGDGKPTGVFTLNELGARMAAEEVLATHKGLSGAALQNYLNSYWAKAWGHFDVNRTGSIPILYAPGLMRFLASDQYMSFQK